MTGVVLETLSNRKLIALGVALLACLLVCFLVGGLIAPAPANVQPMLGTKCLDTWKDTSKTHYHKANWFYPRNVGACESIPNLDDESVYEQHIMANQVVFAFQIPLPKDGMELDMSRWFQNMIGILQVEIDYHTNNQQSKDPVMTMDVRLGYANKGPKDQAPNWTEIVRATEERHLSCEIDKKQDNWPLKCDIMPLFELGSVHHDFYLINIRLPVHEAKGVNMGIGAVRNMWVVIISQNGGFTKVWISLKTVFFPVILAVLIWFWRRITQLERSPTLLEKTLFAMGLTMSFLNCPIEWFTLWIDMPFMLLFTDIRQGIFYAMLLCFWIIFAGEHLMDTPLQNSLFSYWKHMGAVLFGCICLFVFEMCERGVQLTNPFYSIWVTQTGTNLALAFIILAGISACLYFLFLSYMIFRVFRNISAKKSALPSMSSARKKYYSGLIFRFKFLMLATLLCAALTVIFFIIGQVSEGRWKWGEDDTLEYTSAFFTGVYGMWNIYVFWLLALYAPSHKFVAAAVAEDTPMTGGDSHEEEVEFAAIPSEASVLTAFSDKSAID